MQRFLLLLLSIMLSVSTSLRFIHAKLRNNLYMTKENKKIKRTYYFFV